MWKKWMHRPRSWSCVPRRRSWPFRRASASRCAPGRAAQRPAVCAQAIGCSPWRGDRRTAGGSLWATRGGSPRSSGGWPTGLICRRRISPRRTCQCSSGTGQPLSRWWARVRTASRPRCLRRLIGRGRPITRWSALGSARSGVTTRWSGRRRRIRALRAMRRSRPTANTRRLRRARTSGSNAGKQDGRRSTS